MKKFPLSFKITALVLTMAFLFIKMESINSHTYKVGIDSYHYKYGCFGSYPSHLAVKCSITGCY
ncbi:hypothetical protein VOI54_12775 [Tamlana sp. 2201CG12-4]|uniref:hypothetical protein n=1 Tax=Tamlana sp. 2201CG12-4 TaxID=3112582 RepID=UPI002DBF328E|nr:hypothetical protein [Tamlana sp. 2201CG12-4]MEC3907896.1 hypothetical protein [Tamlana sp. 2201CG12-4]